MPAGGIQATPGTCSGFKFGMSWFNGLDYIAIFKHKI